MTTSFALACDGSSVNHCALLEWLGVIFVLAIHTLDARDNMLLDVMFGDSPESPKGIRREIGKALSSAKTQLEARGLEYAAFRAALTPQTGRRELALMFDSAVMDDWYGRQAAAAVLPNLNRVGNYSILTGDIIWKDRDQIMTALREEGVIWSRPDIFASQQIYVIYITNLSPSDFEKLIAGTKSVTGAMGYVDCTFAGVMKTILSTCLGTTYVKLGGRFITGHTDDEPDANVNTPGWPLKEVGYDVASIQEIYFNLFLRYKIESSLPGSAFNDGHFSLAAAAGIWRDPRAIPIFVEEAKGQYLASAKGGSLAKAGLTDLSTQDLARTIQGKLSSNYIYNLVWNSEKDFSNFATMIEFAHGGQRTRLRAALKYEDEKLGLVTLFG